MVLFTILLIITIILIAIVVFAVAIGGAAFVLIFADVIVCIAIIAFVMWWLLKK